MTTTQPTMFDTGADLPLFSGTPQPAHPETYDPQPEQAEKQLPLLETDDKKAAARAAYAAKQERRIARLERAAARKRAEGTARVDKAHRMAEIIPFGQPILIGHHSEQRDRNYRDKIHNNFGKGYEMLSEAADLEARAKAAAQNTAIFSDDPDATEKLEAKIARLEKRQEMMRQANKLVRKQDRAGLAEMGYDEAQITALFTPDFCGRVGYADYQLTNNGANIRRLRERIKDLERAAARPEAAPVEIGGVRIEENKEANRLQIFFPGKPGAEVRADLKARGFRWAPSEGAWQRQLTNDARHVAQTIVNKHYK